MPRPELLALSPDDLAVITNRGVVKRAQRELDSGEVTGTVAEADDGTITAKWSDGAECTLPAGKVVKDGRCNCSATETCRHIVRTVLAYQRQSVEAGSTKAEAGEAGEGTPTTAAPAGPWDPGAIGDDALAALFKPAALTRARDAFDQGLLVELVRGAKPSAKFHVPPHTVRFLVPNDLRYTHCDCAEPPPCRHVPLAVWAFRRLDPQAVAGLVSTETEAAPVPVELLDDVESALANWAEHGTAGAPGNFTDHLARLVARCQSHDLAWPADVVDELARQYERYAGHDALFDPDQVAALVGELVIRLDAIRSATGAVPQLLIRGSRSDRPTEIGSARYMGLGCGVQVERKSVALNAYLQDVDTGTIVVVAKEFADPPRDSGEPPRDFLRLGQTAALKGASLTGLGAGQLVMQGGKRTPGNRLVVGRGRAVVNPQAFTWEQVRTPVLAEDFDELRARLSLLPPASLRPRRVAEDFHVVPIAGVEAAGFDSATQSARAVVLDARGGRALLVHPYHSRGQAGTEAMLRAFGTAGSSLRFVAGPARLTSAGLTIAPVGLVFEKEGSGRSLVQPWVDRAAGPGSAEEAPAAAASHSQASRPLDPAEDYSRRLLVALGETLLMGLARADDHSAGVWRELARYGEALGFDRLARPVSALAAEIESKRHSARWDPTPAARLVLEVALLARLTTDLSG
ncbi:MAG: hypothetical protein U0835_18150 [Isosphaeraceae bacterium]